MGRPMAEHGTYRAYLRCWERPGGPCAECQMAANARNATQRERARGAPVASPENERLVGLERRIRLEALKIIDAVDALAFGPMIDASVEVEHLLDEWCETADEAVRLGEW